MAEVGVKKDGRSEAGQALCWLHLSDLHVAGEVWQQDLVLKALSRDLPGLLGASGLAPRMVFVTGDISQRGQQRELEAAHRFLAELSDKLGLPAGESLFVVPGNHDVDRARIRRMVQRDQDYVLGLDDPDTFRDEVGQRLGDPRDLESYGDRLAAYCTFTSRLLGPARAVSVDRPWRTDVREPGGLRVGVASLCSAWTCGPDEDRKGRIVLGERQVRAAADEIADAGFRVALLHHPPDWLHTAEDRVVAELLHDRFHLILHGHTHDAGTLARGGPGDRSLVCAAGAAYTGGRWPKGVQAGVWSPEKGETELHLYAYSDRDGGFWHPAEGARKGSKGGVLRLPLWVEGVQVAPTAERDEALAARIAAAAKSVLGNLSFLGVPADTSPKPRSGLSDVFVPLDLEGERQEKGRVKLEEVQGPLFGAAEPAPRLMILGDPGSGKTTLLRHLALSCAEARPPRAPLLLALRDWPGVGQDLVNYMINELTSRYQVSIDRPRLDHLCEDGQAILFIDGFDEVADPGQREWVRDAVSSLAARFPRLPMVATSRIVGYDAAPLNRQEFRHLRLAPFDDDQLRAFVIRWTEATEADPVTRAERRADLISALDAEPRAKELARNPLFATLIALVHQTEARLPGERAQLYELLVRMMLETRPAATHQRFADPRLDEGRQRAVLERLALWMQKGRSGEERGEITIRRADLESVLSDLLIARELADESRASVDALVSRWVAWLAARTGILVEQQAGVFGWLHLSVMEYLAGRALYEQLSVSGDTAVANCVVERHQQAHWRETLLLMLGREARRRVLVDTVIAALLEREGWEVSRRWITATFALACLREELDLSGSLRDRLQAMAARIALDVWPDSWEDARLQLADVLRFGRRHGAAVSRWLDRRLSIATRDDLLGVVILLPRTAGHLMSGLPVERQDRAEQAGTLLELWPGDLWGCWAAEAVSRAGVLGWAMDSLEDVVLCRAQACAERRWTLGSAVTCLSLLRRSGLVDVLVRGAASSNGGQRPPKVISWYGSGVEIDVAPASSQLRMEHQREVRPEIAGRRYFSRDVQRYLWRDASHHFSLELSLVHAKTFPRDYSRDLSLDLANDFERYLSFNASRALIRHFVRDLSQDYTHYLTRDLAHRFVLEFSMDKSDLSLFDLSREVSRDLSRHLFWRPQLLSAYSMRITDTLPWQAFQWAEDEKAALQATSALMIRAAAEAHAGLLPMVGNPDPPARDRAAMLMTLRVQNYWIYLYFEPLVSWLLNHNPLPPESHALLLALGIACHQTLWTWPWGDHWANLSGGDPPDHWLPNFFWHQVQALSTRDPATTTAALTRAEAALDRADWPELAAELRAAILEPTPQEILDLFDDGSGPPARSAT